MDTKLRTAVWDQMAETDRVARYYGRLAGKLARREKWAWACCRRSARSSGSGGTASTRNRRSTCGVPSRGSDPKSRHSSPPGPSTGSWRGPRSRNPMHSGMLRQSASIESRRRGDRRSRARPGGLKPSPRREAEGGCGSDQAQGEVVGALVRGWPGRWPCGGHRAAAASDRWRADVGGTGARGLRATVWRSRSAVVERLSAILGVMWRTTGRLGQN